MDNTNEDTRTARIRGKYLPVALKEACPTTFLKEGSYRGLA